MSLSSSVLSTYAPTLSGMTLADIRAELRRARKVRKRDGLTLDRLEENSGVDRAVIHRIENVKKYPRYKPGMETILRLIEGMGLTLPVFFLGVRDLQKTGLQAAIPLSQDSASHPREATSHGLDVSTLDDMPDDLTDDQRAETLRLRAREAAATASAEQATTPHRPKPVRRRSRPKRH